MTKLRLIVAGLMLSLFPAIANAAPVAEDAGQVAGPPSGPAAVPLPPARWLTVGSDAAHPLAVSPRSFDFAFDEGHLPVLAFVTQFGEQLRLLRWNGQAWSNLPGQAVNGSIAEVRMASGWAGDVVVAVRVVSLGGGQSIRVFRLDGTQMQPLGQDQPAGETTGFSIAVDAQGPVIAWIAAGIVRVMRWNGAAWARLGDNVSDQPFASSPRQQPALAVTGTGRLIVAYTRPQGDASGTQVKAWSGGRWTALGQPIPGGSPSLAGMDNGAPALALQRSLGVHISLSDGSNWHAVSPPCNAGSTGTVLGPPFIMARPNDVRVICALGGSLIQRDLIGWGFTVPSGWQLLGSGRVNGQIPLARGQGLAYVAHSGRDGKLWVAWTAEGADVPLLILSTLAEF